MSAKVFKSLSQGLTEAGEILRGESTDFRQFTRTRPAKHNSATVLAFCVVTDDEDLIAGKVYSVQLLPSNRIAVKDESGETVICDTEDFLLVKFQPSVEKKIRKIVTV